MSKVFIVNHKGNRYGKSVSVYRGEKSLISNVSLSEFNSKYTVTVYEEVEEVNLHTLINSMKTSKVRDKKINAMSNPDLRVILKVKAKYAELCESLNIRYWKKDSIINKLDSCDSIASLKAILSSDKKHFMSINNYDWYLTILSVHNFKVDASTPELFLKAKNDLKVSLLK